MADLANSTRAPSRRALLSLAASTAALGSVAGIRIAVGAESNPDADILAAEAPTLALIDEAVRLDAKLTAAEELIEEMTRPMDFSEIYRTRVAQVEERIGYTAIADASDGADQAATSACRTLAEMRATTLAGLAVKARIGSRWAGTRLYDSIVSDLLAMAPRM